jgi:hypothetical protein
MPQLNLSLKTALSICVSQLHTFFLEAAHIQQLIDAALQRPGLLVLVGDLEPQPANQLPYSSADGNPERLCGINASPVLSLLSAALLMPLYVLWQERFPIIFLHTIFISESIFRSPNPIPLFSKIYSMSKLISICNSFWDYWCTF